MAETGIATRFESHSVAMGRWFDVYASRIGESAQRLVALVFKDITAPKEAEAARESLLSAESSARKQAEDAVRLQDEFIATVSHELRTPLHSILGWIRLLRMGSVAPDRQERALETIERNARAQAQLIDDLLDFSAIQAGKMRLDVQPLDVRAVVEAAVEIVRPAAEAKQVGLQCTLASGCVVIGDPGRLQQVVWNLVANAVKFTAKHGRVQVVLKCDDSAAQITVADTGQGIDSAFLPYVFERFRQADGSSRRAKGGLGLGLASSSSSSSFMEGRCPPRVRARGRVRRSRSASRSRSSSDEPPHRSPPPPAARGQIRCPPSIRGMVALVVDDESDARAMVRATLEACGVQVIEADSVKACLRALDVQVPSVIVSDVGMPGEDGYALIQKLRALPEKRGGSVPVIALTAYARPQDRTNVLLAGFDTHVAKPVDPMEFLAILARIHDRTRKGF